MKCFLILLTFSSLAIISKAQSAEDSVKMAINTMFSGMKNGDAGLFKSVFSDSAIMQTISRNKEGKIIVINESLKDFAVIGENRYPDADTSKISFDEITRPVLNLAQQLSQLVLAFGDIDFAPTVETIRPE